MKMTLGQAAKHTGFSKPTLSRAIQNGKLSAARLDDGSFAIDPAELERWNDNNGHRNHPETRIATDSETPETPNDSSPSPVELEVLRERLTILEAERDRERRQLVGQIEDLRQDRNHWREQAERTTKLLPPPPESLPVVPPAVADKPKRRWWHFPKSDG